MGWNAGEPLNLQQRLVRALTWPKSLVSVGVLVLLTACGGGVATSVPSTADRDETAEVLHAETLSPQVILNRALASTKEQLSYCFRYDYEAEILFRKTTHDRFGHGPEPAQEGVWEYIESVTSGKFQAPSQFETKGTTTFVTSNDSVTISGEAITIGVTVYRKIPPEEEWKVKTREDGVPETPVDKMSIDPSLLSGLEIGGEEQLDGVDVIHLVALVPPGVDIGLADPRLDRRVEYWVGRDDHLIRRYVFAGRSPSEGGFTSTITLFDFGKPVEISSPQASASVIPKP